MTKEDAFELIKNKPHLPIHGALFTTNIFGQTVQRQGKDILIDGDQVKIIDTASEDNFLDSIMPANNDFSKLVNQQPTTTTSNDTWYIDAIAQHKATFFNEPLPVANNTNTVGDSIFSNEQENGINSKLGDWFKPIQDKIEEDKNKKKEVLKILVKKIVGPNEIYINKTIEYRITDFNVQKFNLSEIVPKIKWGYSIDDRTIIQIKETGIAELNKQEVTLKFKVPNIRGTQLRMYAWLEKPIKDVSMVSNIKIAPPLVLFVCGYWNKDLPYAGSDIFKNYWENYDVVNKKYVDIIDYKNLAAIYFKTKINQEIFINGADTKFSNGRERFKKGYEFAKSRLTNIQSNLYEEIMTDKDSDNYFTRPIIIISHSMGGAFAEGMLAFFKKLSLNIIKVIHFSPADTSDFSVSYPDETHQINIIPDPVLSYKNFDDKLLIKSIKNACFASNPKDIKFGHMYTKQEEFVWNWFEDLDALKVRPLRVDDVPTQFWGSDKKQIYELVYFHNSKFTAFLKNGVIYKSLEFLSGSKTTKNEYVKTSK